MISLIVPVYNVEEYLEECLESIRKQTYQDIEVILVNDGSTDGSHAICERYCQMDKRFRLINQKKPRSKRSQKSWCERIPWRIHHVCR